MISLAREGDKDAFAELVHRRQADIRQLMRRFSNDHALADDLSQQAFLQAFIKISSLKDYRAFGGWLKRLAINTWLQHCRKRDLLSESDEPEGIPGTRETPAMAIDLDAALSTLKSKERLCIVLAYQEGMSHQEISDLTTLPLGTVKSHIKRGTEQLKASLAAYRNTPITNTDLDTDSDTDSDTTGDSKP